MPSSPQVQVEILAASSRLRQQADLNGSPVWSPSGACPVTRPNGAQRPGRPPAPDGYANDALWTLLWPEGRVVFAPDGAGFMLPDGSLGMKWPWFPLLPGEFSIEGRRLDRRAAPLRSEIREAYDASGRFFASYLIFPEPGCWEVTGRIGEASLTFVTLVIKEGDGPSWRPESVP